MAKYKPIIMVEYYRGKICGHSDTYFQKRGRTLCTGRICNPRDINKKPYSAAELARQQKFAQTRAAVKALTTEQKTAYAEAFKSQTKYATLQGYIFAKEYEKIGE